MNKETFLSRLEQLLYDIPREEREEAMDYYRSYFEEAGVENEAAVLEELDSPQEIAASIKEDLKRPEKEAWHLKNPLQVRTETERSRENGGESSEGKTAGYRRYDEPDPKESGYRRYDESDQTESGYRRYDEPDPKESGYRRYTEPGRENAKYRRYDEPRQDASAADSGRYEQYEKQAGSRRAGSMDKQAKLILLVILAFFSFPLWGSAASVLLGLAGLGIAAVCVLAVLTAGGLIGGLVCVIVGIVNLCMLSLVKGLIALGTGMLLIAAGGISFVIVMFICGRFLPWAVRQIVNLLRRLMDWGRSIA